MTNLQIFFVKGMQMCAHKLMWVWADTGIFLGTFLFTEARSLAEHVTH